MLWTSRVQCLLYILAPTAIRQCRLVLRPFESAISQKQAASARVSSPGTVATTEELSFLSYRDPAAISSVAPSPSALFGAIQMVTRAGSTPNLFSAPQNAKVSVSKSKLIFRDSPGARLNL